MPGPSGLSCVAVTSTLSHPHCVVSSLYSLLIISSPTQLSPGEACSMCFVFFSVGQAQSVRFAHLFARYAGAWASSHWGLPAGGQELFVSCVYTQDSCCAAHGGGAPS